MPEPALLTLEQAAAYIGAATSWTVRRLMHQGKIPAIKIGKRFNFRKSDLDEYIKKNMRREGAA